MKSDFVSIKLPPPTLTSTKRKEKLIFPFWFQIVFITSIVLFTVLLIHHEVELSRCTGHEDRITELEARVLELMNSISLKSQNDVLDGGPENLNVSRFNVNFILIVCTVCRGKGK